MTTNGNRLQFVFERNVQAILTLPDVLSTGARIGTPEYDKGFLMMIRRTEVCVFHREISGRFPLIESDATDFLEFQDDKLYQHRITTVPTHKYPICISVYLDVNMLEMWLNQGMTIPSRFQLMTWLLNGLTKNTPSLSRDELCRTLLEPLSTPSIEPPAVALHQQTTNVELFEFQKRKVHWMHKIEDEIIASNGITIQEPTQPTLMELSPIVTVDFSKMTFIPTDPAHSSTTPRKFRGGCIFDDPGLGKTYTVATRCMQDRHTRETTAATLIICPSEACQHWKTVINLIDPQAAVEIICAKRSLRSMTTRVMSTVNYVITTHTFVEQNAKCVAEAYGSSMHSLDLTDVDAVYRGLLAERILQSKDDKFHTLQFHQYRWRRTIVDDADMTPRIFEIMGFVRNLWTDFVWLLSGAIGNVLHTSSDYLYFTDLLAVRGSNESPRRCTPTLANILQFQRLLCTRDTIDTIKPEIELPDCREQVFKLEFTSEERAAYEVEASSGSFLSLGDFCLDPVIVTEARVVSTKEEALELIQLKHGEREIELLQLVGNIREMLSSPAALLNERIRAQSQMELSTAVSKLQALSHKREYISKSMNMTETTIVCSVCLSTPSAEESLCMTQCGHVFCWVCAHTWIQENHRCSFCREPTTEREIIHIKPKRQTTISEELQDSIEKYGTKMAYFLDYIQRHKNEKIVVFATTEVRLRFICGILGAHDFKFGRCYGKEAERSKAIGSFMNPLSPVNIFILTPTHICRGASLAISNKIIFIEQFYKDEVAKTTMEKMCIARVRPLSRPIKTLEIIRFVMKDTLEEELYTRLSPSSGGGCDLERS